MKVTITAPFGRVQVEMDAWEAVTLMTRAVQAAGEQVLLSAEGQPAAADDTVQPAAPERADTEECCARDESAESESGGTEQAAGADPADSQGNDHSVGVPETALQRGGSDRETKDFGGR